MFAIIDKYSNKRFAGLCLKIMICAFVFLSVPVFMGQKVSRVSASKTEELESQIKELERKLSDAKQQADSLGREISILENSIALKRIQIKQANYQIEQKKSELGLLKEDIRLLEVRLDRLDETIEYHQKLLGLRIRRQYMDQQSSFLEFIVGSSGMGDLVARAQYMQEVEAQDHELLQRMDETKGNYEEQQDLLREKKNQVEALKKEIERQKAQAEVLKQTLEQQKEDKDNLLRITKNNEDKYKELLEAAKKELAQIQSAANIVIREGKGVKVEKGELIGTMGNSGFSTGAHLHFGVYKYSVESFQSHEKWDWYYSNYIDPLSVLKPKTVRWDTGCHRDPKGDKKVGGGNWAWPMDSPRITQNYGSKTCYNWMYGNKPHPALDMVGMGNISVRAIADGNAYFCRNCLGDGANGVFIFHDGEKMSIYWHLK